MIAVVTLVWSLPLTVGVSDFGVYSKMFVAWQMVSLTLKEAREASGVLRS